MPKGKPAAKVNEKEHEKSMDVSKCAYCGLPLRDCECWKYTESG